MEQIQPKPIPQLVGFPLLAKKYHTDINPNPDREGGGRLYKLTTVHHHIHHIIYPIQFLLPNFNPV